MLPVLFAFHILFVLSSTTPTIKWELNTNGAKVLGGPAIDVDNNLYLGVGQGLVYKISPNGKAIWTKTYECHHQNEEILPDGIPVSCQNAVPSDFDMSTMPSSIWYQIGGKYPVDFGGTSPILMNNDTELFIVDKDCGILRILNTKNGNTLWSFNIYSINETTNDYWDYGGGLYSSPALSNDGKTLYVPSGMWWGDQWYEASQLGVDFRQVTKRKLEDRRLYAFVIDRNNNGLKLKWIFDAEYTDTNRTAFFSSPAIDSEGRIFVGNFNGYMYGIKDNENTYELLWKYAARNNTNPLNLPVYNNVSWPTYSEWWSSPAISSDSKTVYIGNNDYKLYAFDTATGNIKWSYYMTGQIFQSPVIGGDGTIYIECENDLGNNEGANGNLYALNPDGTLKWKTITSKKSEGVPAGCAVVLDDETVIIGSSQSTVWAYNGTNGNQLWKMDNFGGGIDMAPTIGNYGTIYLHDVDTLYALSGDIPLNKKSSWPKFRKNSRNTASNCC